MPGATLSSNWKKLQSSLAGSNEQQPRTSSSLKRKRPSSGAPPSRNHTSSSTSATAPGAAARKRPRPMTRPAPPPPAAAAAAAAIPSASQPLVDITLPPLPSQLNCGATTAPAGRYLALDCEMVSTRLHTHSLARVSVTNYHHAIVYDSFVLPADGDPVTDHRTHVSGVTARSLRPGYARPLDEVRGAVAGLLRGRVLVGHALSNDLKVLALDHPGYNIRDTARYKGYKVYAGGRTPGLKTLAREVLRLSVQEGMHDSVIDARVAMELFRREKGGMEAEVRRKYGGLVARVGREVVMGKVGSKGTVEEKEETPEVDAKDGGIDEESSVAEGSELLDGETEDGDDDEKSEEEVVEGTSEVKDVKKKRKKKRKHKSRTSRA